MSNFVVSNIFIPGTKAKATEVNENFAEVQDELNRKALKNGDETQTFKVAKAVNDNQAVNRQQMQEITQSLITEKINNYKVYTKYVINSGMFTDGVPVYLRNNGTVVILKSGTVYTDSATTYTVEEDLTEDVSLYEDGTYNIFVENGTDLIILPNNVTIDGIEPNENTQDDYWLNIQEPLQAYVYDNYEWVKSEKLCIGKVTIENGAISKLTVCNLNQNGICVNANTQGYRMPDFTATPEVIIGNTVYLADEDCFLVANVLSTASLSHNQINVSKDSAFTTSYSLCESFNGGGMSGRQVGSAFIPKGMYYKITQSASTTNYRFPLVKKGF